MSGEENLGGRRREEGGGRREEEERASWRRARRTREDLRGPPGTSRLILAFWALILLILTLLILTLLILTLLILARRTTADHSHHRLRRRAHAPSIFNTETSDQPQSGWLVASTRHLLGLSSVNSGEASPCTEKHGEIHSWNGKMYGA